MFYPTSAGRCGRSQTKVAVNYHFVMQREMEAYCESDVTLPGAHHWEPATIPYFCHGVFTDQPIFSLDLS